MLVGCASQQIVEREASFAAAALTYDVPVPNATMAEREEIRQFLDARLARADRGETALLGYDTASIELYRRDVDDRQLLFGGTGSFGYYGGFGFGGPRVRDFVTVRERSLTTFTRTRPAGELN
jgi:hypothetical protein